MDGDQMRGDRHLYFLHPTKSQLMLENQWPGMWGIPGGRSVEGRSGAVISSDSIIWEQTGNVLGCDV